MGYRLEYLVPDLDFAASRHPPGVRIRWSAVETCALPFPVRPGHGDLEEFLGHPVVERATTRSETTAPNARVIGEHLDREPLVDDLPDLLRASPSPTTRVPYWKHP